MKMLRAIIQSGISPTDKYQVRRGLIITNWLSLILSAALVLNFIVRYSLYHDVANAPDPFFILLGLVLFCGPILLNRLSFTLLSRLFLCASTVTFFWIVFLMRMSKMPSIETSLYDTFRIFLLTVSIIPYLLFDHRKISHLVLAVIPTFVSLIFFEYFLGLVGLNHSQRGIPGDDYQLMQMRTLVSYFIISGGCFTFQSIIMKNDEVNQKLLTELNESAEEIKAQNEELHQSHEKLNELNQHLEHLVEIKTESIKKQNEALIKYAYTNAHYVRGPLARLLGLIQLSKMKTELSYPWFFEKVEEETKAMDEIVKRIGRDLNEVEEQNKKERLG